MCRRGVDLEGQSLLSPVKECARASEPHACREQRTISDSQHPVMECSETASLFWDSLVKGFPRKEDSTNSFADTVLPLQKYQMTPNARVKTNRVSL